MSRYILRRILLIIPILIGVVVVIFTIGYFSKTSPAVVLLGSAATPENIAAKEHEMGLDRPYLVQLAEYFWNILSKRSLGTSYVYKTPVTSLIASSWPPTIKIGLISVVLTVLIGIPLGIISAIKQGTVFDYTSTVLSVVLYAVPNFWIAMLMVLLFSVRLKWLPIQGLATWKHYILPVVAVGIGPIAMLTRMTRSSMLEVIRQDYIRTARSKGIAESKVIIRHALKNALIPVVTLIGVLTGCSVTGSIIIETIFNIPGLGLLIYKSISNKDFITVQGCVLVCALFITLMNLLTEISYVFIDPRIKAQYENAGRRRRKVTVAAPAAGQEGGSAQ